MVNIQGLDKARVLQVLWNRSKMQGLSFLGFNGEDLSLQECQRLITERTAEDSYGKPHCRFDYLNGKVMKVDLGGEEFDEYLYDRDNGPGAAARAVDSIR